MTYFLGKRVFVTSVDAYNLSSLNLLYVCGKSKLQSNRVLV